MTVCRILVSALVVLASPLAGQTDAVDDIPVSGPERPAEVVARMARQAMGIPSDPEAWQALADALPDLALTGEADLEATFEAVRLADSLSAVMRGGDVAATDTEETSVSGGWMPPLPASLSTGQRRTALAGFGAVLAGLLLLFFRRPGKKPDPSTREGRAALGAARSLATRGLPAYEIARQTGMAQDAVEVMLAMSGVASVYGRTKRGEEPLQTSRRRVSPPQPALDDLDREARLAAARLRDRRLTYGPGVRA